jgi:hypothetical protein
MPCPLLFDLPSRSDFGGAYFAFRAVQSVSVRAVPGAAVSASVLLSVVFAIPSTTVFALVLSSSMGTDAGDCTEAMACRKINASFSHATEFPYYALLSFDAWCNWALKSNHLIDQLTNGRALGTTRLLQVAILYTLMWNCY